MESLKTIMEKLDDMKLSDKVMNDGDYKILMDELKKAYDKHNLGKFVRVMRVSTCFNVFWEDTDGASSINSNRVSWAHRSWVEGNEDDDGASHLNKVEVELNNTDAYHTLKIIENTDGRYEYTKSIDWEKNTIKVGCYEKMKITKFISNLGETIIYINDIE
tara:strand:+ start:37 stop:519 length:483 start_codon:yes stop_codon:yes gene_type:complete